MRQALKAASGYPSGFVRMQPIAGTTVRNGASVWPAIVEDCVVDAGLGLVKGEEQRAFRKFHRGHEEAVRRGFGFRLCIGTATIDKHDGGMHPIQPTARPLR